MTNSSKRRARNSPRSSNKYYPVFLDLRGKKCVIVGGGRVAERKCASILKAGPQVTVISPALTHRLESYKEKGLIRHLKRAYKSGDIRSAFIAIAATDCEETNRMVASDAARHNILLNVVDRPALCSFIAPSVVRSGDLVVAVSTGGASPAMARTIRIQLEGLFGSEFRKYLRLLKHLRVKAKNNINDRKTREMLLNALASPEALRLLEQKGFDRAKKAAIELFMAAGRENQV